MRLDWNVELALLEETEVTPEAALDVDEVSADVEHEFEPWIVVDVTGSERVEAEKTEVREDDGVELPPSWKLLAK